MSAPQVHIASDYAVLDAGEWSFYYGYEWGSVRDEDGDRVEVWGFRATRSGTVVFSLPYEDMAAQLALHGNRFEVVELLLLGIGLVLSEGEPA